jgi:SAM-dependent methyltransferase
MSTAPAQPVDQTKLHDFIMKAVGEMGAAMNAALILVGDKLGLYKAMAGTGPLTSSEIASKTGTHERYVREWLASQAAGGFITYDPATSRYNLPAEQAMALADESSPVFLPGFFEVIEACIKDVPKITDAFKTGKGVGWHEHEGCLFTGTERFFRPNYRAHLVAEWIPALGDVEAKLKSGATVADVGCGLGTSTVLMAQAYPKSKFVGFDYHPRSIELAREAAHKAGVSDRVKFEIAKAKDFPGKGYQFVAFFDCLHDMGDPEGAARHVLQSLDPNGTWMIVEPFANDKLEDNLNPIGRVFYGASTMLCTPASVSQEVGLALGAQAGEGRLTSVLKSAGFKRVRRAAETPFNIVLEARP